MSKEDAPANNPPYRLSQYSIPNLLNLLTTARAQKAFLEVGYTPVLIFKDQRIEIDGPDVVSEVMEALVRSIASTRQLRILRENGSVDIIHTFENSRFLIRAVDAFGIFRLDLAPIKIS